ncbi:MAG: ABC transporter ATP-binding protein [Candidatus Cohnella colombiensis]|uniref:ABC transporter ATP-binding protein n=1 Tax=Candidatus Cohnella colombiensis TaxID=3121368 RepID=A0AA95F3J7_9BACL|nr:MAG: ABC transporter ATP-binding protein [Cohnella sp.]
MLKSWRRRSRTDTEAIKGGGTKEAFSNNLYILKLVWQIHPQRLVAEMASSALEQGSRVFFTVIFIRYLLEAMEKGDGFENVAIFIIVSTIVFTFINFWGHWFQNRFKPISDTILYEKLYVRLFEKAGQVELNCYENPEFYHKYTVAINEADTRVSAVIATVSNIIFSIIAAISVFAVMFSIDPYVVLFALCPIIGEFLIGKRLNKMYFNRYMDSVPSIRRMDYVNRTLYLSNYAKEIRLSNIFNVLKSIYYEGYLGVLRVIDKYKGKVMFVDFWRNFFTFLVIFQGVLLYSAYRAMISETITLSEFSVLATAMVSGAWMLIHMSESFVKVYENGIYINNLHYFLNYQSEVEQHEGGEVPSRDEATITFSDVSFSYIGAERSSMRNVSLTISNKAKVALVGHNGAGKTTFIKLLMRLYDPTSGQIEVNGRPIRAYHLGDYRSLFGAAFQDYQVFSMTIAENVLMKEIETEAERDRVIEALQKSGVYDRVMSLPKGIDTILTREFDDEGVLLSGGELQKIAIARVFAKDVDFVIMDEPTSALDPIAEYQLYESIREGCADKTVLFISHRLSSAVLADRIYLFEDGAITEEGTHDELMKLDGKYAEMFKKQAEQYVENDVPQSSVRDRLVKAVEHE